MSVDEFRNRNDLDYSRWLADHSRGNVINIERTYNPRDARLHAAYCETITGTPHEGTLSPAAGSRSVRGH
jgi:hypothetical protein